MSDDDTVVGIRPGVRPSTRAEPKPEVVDHLEELLAEAKAGELIGVATVATYMDNTAAHGNAGTFTRATISMLFSCMVALNHAIDGKEAT